MNAKAVLGFNMVVSCVPVRIVREPTFASTNASGHGAVDAEAQTHANIRRRRDCANMWNSVLAAVSVSTRQRRARFELIELPAKL